MKSPFDPTPGDDDQTVARVYATQTAPLLPSRADITAYEEALALGGTALQVLVLGVTPALHDLHWPSGSTVRAVDRSVPMINHVWPGPAGTAQAGDWDHLPFPDAQFDRVVSDGGLAFLGPETIGAVRSEVARVLQPGGMFVARFYAWDRTEHLDRVINDVLGGAVATVNEMRIRSWSALQTSLDLGVTVGTAFDAVVARVGSVEQLVAQSGLDASEFVPFLASAESTVRYTMWPVEDIVAAWTRSGAFEHIGTTIPEHHLGHLCPVIAFRRALTT